MTTPSYVFANSSCDISVSSLCTETQFDSFVEEELSEGVRLFEFDRPKNLERTKSLDSQLQRWKSSGFGASMEVLPECDDFSIQRRESTCAKSERSNFVPPKRPNRNASIVGTGEQESACDSAVLPPRRPNRSDTINVEKSSGSINPKTNVSNESKSTLLTETCTIPSSAYSTEFLAVKKMSSINISTESLNSKLPLLEDCLIAKGSDLTGADYAGTFTLRTASHDSDDAKELEDEDSKVAL